MLSLNLLYLLHWPNGITDYAGVVTAFEKLRSAGKVRAWGVSNFSVSQLEKLFRVPQGDRCATNQVPYSVGDRGIERDLLSLANANRELPTIKKRVPLLARSAPGTMRCSGQAVCRNADRVKARSLTINFHCEALKKLKGRREELMTQQNDTDIRLHSHFVFPVVWGGVMILMQRSCFVLRTC